MGLPPRSVGLLLLDAFAEMTLVHGWTHGDPHPGNILVRPDPRPRGLLGRLLPAWAGGGPRAQLVLLDHGVYVRLPPRERGLYCQLWCTIVLGDREGATEVRRLGCWGVGKEHAVDFLSFSLHACSMLSSLPAPSKI